MALSKPEDIAGLLGSAAATPSNQIQKAATDFRDAETVVEQIEDNWNAYLEEDAPNEDAPIENLTDYICQAYQDAKACRQANCIDDKIMSGRRRWKGEYTMQERALMPKIDVFFHLTRSLSNIALGFLRSILKPDEDNPIWELEPSPIPALPEFAAERAARYAASLVQQEAMATAEPITEERANEIVEDLREQLFEAIDHQAEIHTRNLQRKLYDNLEIADFDKVFDQFLQDIVKDPNACIKGPYTSAKKIKKWEDGKLVYPMEKYQRFDNVDVANMFPSSDSVDTQTGSYIIEITQMTRRQLKDAAKLDGFIAKNIDTVLCEFDDKSSEWLNSLEGEMEAMNDQVGKFNDYDAVDVIEFHGKVPGHILHHADITEWDSKEIDPKDEYEMEVWVCCKKIIRAVEQCNPMGRPYHCASLFPNCHSFWGESIPHRVEDEQRAANAAFRAAIRDMGYTSGPIVNVDVSLLDDNQKLPEEFHAGMVIKTNSRKRGLAGNAMNIEQLQSQAERFMALVDKFFLNAEMITGINRQMLGQSQPGVGTLGEAQILQQNANTGLQSMLVNIDCALESLIEMAACQIMTTTDDQSLKADARVVGHGATSLLTRELNRQNLLQVLNTLMPIYQSQPSIVEPDGMLCLIREISRGYGLDPNKFTISPAEAKQRRIELQVAQLQGGGGGGIAGGVSQAPQTQSPLAAQDSIQPQAA